MGITQTTPTLRRILIFCGVSILILSTLLYIAYQARNIILGPSITLEDTHTIVHTERTVLLAGTAKNIVQLTVNGKEIHTDASGAFAHTLVLEKGYSVVLLTAEDRFGRTTTVRREYVYEDTAPEVSAVYYTYSFYI